MEIPEKIGEDKFPSDPLERCHLRWFFLFDKVLKILFEKDPNLVTIEFRISNGTNYLAHGRSEAKMQDQRSLWDFRSRRTVFRSIALRSAKPSGALLERARSV